MPANVHPRLFNTRGMVGERAADGGQIRVLVYTPAQHRASWVEAELSHRSVIVQVGHSVAQVVSALVEDPPPRPQILVADVDDMSPGDLMHLHVLREQGWFGRIIALGNLPAELQSSLAVERVLRVPLVRGALRDVIVTTDFIAATTKLPVQIP